MHTFTNDEISPNPASQGSPNTKKHSASSDYQKDIEVHALYDDENKDHVDNSARKKVAAADVRANGGDQSLQKGMSYLAIDELEEDD